MRLYRSLSSLDSVVAATPRVATIGAFDGLHIGHQEILSRTMRIAAEHGAPAMVCTFEPTPAEYFSPASPPARLTCFRERVELLDRTGLAEMFCPRFASLKNWSAERFLEELLLERLNIRHLVVGHDFRYGAGRRGTLEDLRQAAQRTDFELTTIDPVYVDGQRVSSTGIRRALAEGDLTAASRMLGRDYSISGRVVHGRNLGRSLGFPTANVNLKRRLAPVHGIFAVQVEGIDDRPLDGVASVGSRPTVGGGETILEVYVFDFDRDIYGTYIKVNFVARLREERKFPDLQSMQRQMHLDVDDAQAALKQRIA